ncbi:hypothetical protein [Streptomyces sp. NPDC008121]|uniref:hypothetical protein n=1 Tax=Streptomyces sp. NPDC008121 TaxID=3364809 RepID=UPI0036EE4D42
MKKRTRMLVGGSIAAVAAAAGLVSPAYAADHVSAAAENEVSVTVENRTDDVLTLGAVSLSGTAEFIKSPGVVGQTEINPSGLTDWSVRALMSRDAMGWATYKAPNGDSIQVAADSYNQVTYCWVSGPEDRQDSPSHACKVAGTPENPYVIIADKG